MKRCLRTCVGVKSIGILKYLFLLISFSVFSQENWSVAVQTYKGSILPHSNNIKHLITNKPTGILISANYKTKGDSDWQQRFNNPDIGVSLHSQFNHNETLGDLYGIYGHYNFYFLKKRFQFRIAQGVSYATNPFNKETNVRNVAYGSKFMPSTYFMCSYDQPRIYKNIGINAGVLFVHHSNATIKSPNTSTNTVGLNLGLTYHFEDNDVSSKVYNVSEFNNRWRYNVIFRTGINESHIIGMGQKAFYHLSGSVEKPINEFGGVQLGGEVFLSNSLKELIPFLAESFPETNMKKDTDWKRAGVFIGYEMYLNKLTAEANIGYYLHDEYKENGALYQRLGLRYYVYDNVFTVMSLKTHFAKAEAFEIGLGYKF